MARNEITVTILYVVVIKILFDLNKGNRDKVNNKRNIVTAKMTSVKKVKSLHPL